MTDFDNLMYNVNALAMILEWKFIANNFKSFISYQEGIQNNFKKVNLWQFFSKINKVIIIS